MYIQQNLLSTTSFFFSFHEWKCKNIDAIFYKWISEASKNREFCTRAFLSMLKIADNAFSRRRRSDDRNREGQDESALSSSSPHRVAMQVATQCGIATTTAPRRAAPRRAASRRHRRRVYMQLSVSETSRRTPPAGRRTSHLISRGVFARRIAPRCFTRPADPCRSLEFR